MNSQAFWGYNLPFLTDSAWHPLSLTCFSTVSLPPTAIRVPSLGKASKHGKIISLNPLVQDNVKSSHMFQNATAFMQGPRKALPHENCYQKLHWGQMSILGHTGAIFHTVPYRLVPLDACMYGLNPLFASTSQKRPCFFEQKKTRGNLHLLNNPLETDLPAPQKKSQKTPPNTLHCI